MATSSTGIASFLIVNTTTWNDTVSPDPWYCLHNVISKWSRSFFNYHTKGNERHEALRHKWPPQWQATMCFTVYYSALLKTDPTDFSVSFPSAPVIPSRMERKARDRVEHVTDPEFNIDLSYFEWNIREVPKVTVSMWTKLCQIQRYNMTSWRHLIQNTFCNEITRDKLFSLAL